MLNVDTLNETNIYASRRIQKFLKQGLAYCLMLDARRRGKSFYCKALKGERGDICINSDLSVSCNCYDIDGFGKIGHLKKQPLAQIFAGKKANYFRKSLASGKFPILDCVRCSSLRLTEKENAFKYIDNFTPPRDLIVIHDFRLN